MKDIVERVHREGAVPFSSAVDIALYGATGFYTLGGGAGRRRDFLTSPEVGSLFGAVVARALDTWWADLGKPDPFFVAECGAGPGALAQAILRAEPECSAALRYLLIDSSEAMRALHRGRKLPLVSPSEVFAAVSPPPDEDDEDDEVVSIPGQGPLCTSLEAFPSISLHVILANELLDNLPFDIAKRTDDGWNEVRVGVTESDLLSTVEVEADGPLAHWGYRFAPDAKTGDVIPVAQPAAQWVSDAFELLDENGRICCIDYGAPTSLLASRSDSWVRTYREHTRTVGITAALGAFGTSDITIDVPVDQLPRPMSITTQAQFLNKHGIAELVTRAREYWDANAAFGDLKALQAKSWIAEANALLDESALGGFAVLEWKR
jgi:SAM-dependent MidA family methyltransferase